MKSFFIFLFVFSISTSLFASSSKEETKLLVEQTAQFCKTHTKKECFEAINSDRFSKDELFIFAFDYDGIGVANGRIPMLIGKDLWYLINQDGMHVFQQQIKVAKEKSGWIQYKWKTPKGKSIEKLSYIMDVDGSFYIGSGLTLKKLEEK